MAINLRKNWKNWLVALISFLSFLFILIWFFGNLKKPRSSPPLSPRAQSITSPSAYATDSAVLEIEKKLEELGSFLETSQTDQIELLPPKLDWEIEFELKD